MLRILHLSSDALPDPRVERAAWSARRAGHEVYFAGDAIQSFHLGENPFQQTYPLHWDVRSRLHLPNAFRKMRRRLSNVLSAVRPDIVHAHNVIAAKLAVESGIPMVYDDHEYWSMWMKAELEDWLKSLLKSPWDAKKSLTRVYGAWLWTRWESDVIQSVPTIAVCEPTAAAHAKKGARVFVVPNMPTVNETRSIPRPKAKGSPLSTVMVGNEFSSPMKIRDSWGALGVFADDSVGELLVVGEPQPISCRNVRTVGFIDHLAMLRELTNHHVGLIPWKPHWFHQFCSPNKGYEYMHAGLIPVFPGTMLPFAESCGDFGHAFYDYRELRQVLTELSGKLDTLQDSRVRLQDYAKRQLCWERFEERIFAAYSHAC